ncbi:MAG: Asp23/Gls24 family envelope stress response protein [Anaerolineaceae bacterium]
MEEDSLGSTKIAPTVLNTIARLTTLATPGVSRMAPISAASSKYANKTEEEGVKILVKDSLIYVDVYVIINSEENVRLVAEAIQQRVNRAISEMVGMEVASVNVHITDLDIEA